MKNRYLKFQIPLFILLFVLTACSKEDDNVPIFTPTPTQPEELGTVITLNPRDIVTTKATLKGYVGQASVAGFVYSTDPNPTMLDNNVYLSTSEPTAYDIEIINLLPNTTYYVRSYIDEGGSSIYGIEKQFKTTGYFGPAGGYVAYDKGELVDGWRYLEIHPTTLNYNISYTSGGEWGGFGTFISGTTDEFGAGVMNTSIIKNGVTSANCAAKLCQNLVLNNYSDWFLPSSIEGLLIANSLLAAGINFQSSSWTSTQVDANYAKTLTYRSSPTPHYETFNAPKTYGVVYIYPVRRY